MTNKNESCKVCNFKIRDINGIFLFPVSNRTREAFMPIPLNTDKTPSVPNRVPDSSQKPIFNNDIIYNAESGNAIAQNELGYAYQFGTEKIKKDSAQALSWYEKAAKQGNIDAQYNYGYMIFNGEGTSVDYVNAVYWFKKAAEKGHAVSQYMLGYMHQHGCGTKQDNTEALYWYSLAAKQGYSPAQDKMNFLNI